MTNDTGATMDECKAEVAQLKALLAMALRENARLRGGLETFRPRLLQGQFSHVAGWAYYAAQADARIDALLGLVP